MLQILFLARLRDQIKAMVINNLKPINSNGVGIVEDQNQNQSHAYQ